jgi:hypothetical protein
VGEHALEFASGSFRHETKSTLYLVSVIVSKLCRLEVQTPFGELEPLGGKLCGECSVHSPEVVPLPWGEGDCEVLLR